MMNFRATALIAAVVFSAALGTAPASSADLVMAKWDDRYSKLDRTFKKSVIWPTGDPSTSRMPSLQLSLNPEVAQGGTIGTETFNAETRKWETYDSQIVDDIKPDEKGIFAWYPHISSDCFNGKNQLVFCDGIEKRRLFLEDGAEKRIYQKLLTLTFIDDGPRFTLQLTGPTAVKAGTSYPLTIKLVGTGKTSVDCSISWGYVTAALFGNSYYRAFAKAVPNKPVVAKINIGKSTENKQYFKVKCYGEVATKTFAVLP